MLATARRERHRTPGAEGLRRAKTSQRAALTVFMHRRRATICERDAPTSTALPIRIRFARGCDPLRLSRVMLQSSKSRVWGIRVLSAISAAIALYLVTSLGSGRVAGCGPASDCQDVLTSGWAYWLGLPVSVPGLVVYGSIFLATFWVLPPTLRRLRRRAWIFLAFAACVVSAAALWFLALQLLVLEHVCPYCLGAHLAGVLSAALIFRATGNPLGRAPVRNAALLAVATLLAGQWLGEPPTHTVVSVPASEPVEGRQMEILDGRFRLDLDKVPIIGHPDAPAVIISLFDYTCRHCRRMHQLLLDAEKAHRGALAIANLPMPLDTSCNPIVTRTAPEHTDACQYARLGLAVWRANPKAMSRFNRWIFDPPTPTGLDSALGFATELVGEEALRRALDDRWVREQLTQSIAIYETVSRHTGTGVMPQLIIGTQLVMGELKGGMPDLETLLGEVLND